MRWWTFSGQPPWRRGFAGRCRRCDSDATHGIETKTDDRMALAVGRNGVATLLTSEVMYTLVCGEHLDEIMDDYCERFGWTTSVPLAPRSWGYWLRSLYWRPVNRLRSYRRASS